MPRLNRGVVLSAFLVTLCALLAAPIFAVSWSHQPFTGFLVEQTLVVDRIGEQAWTGRTTQVSFPQQVTRLAGQAVINAAEYNAILASHRIGDSVPVFTRMPDGTERLFPGIVLVEFTDADLLRLFWLPYLVGAIYLGIGVWIYRLRGDTRPGRALALFCIVTAMTCGLIFDTFSSHALTALWTFAVAQIGGVLIGLALRFPEEWGPIKRRAGIALLPLVISCGLAAWALVAQTDRNDPWAYLPARQASYRYAALGILLFLAVILYRARKGSTPVVRRQARLVLVGSVIAFLPITIWLVAPLFGVSAVFDPAVFLPSLLLFPISVGLAILRYRLWEVDTIVNQAFVYGLLTAILAGVFAAMIGFTQRLFLAVTGEQSDVAVVLTTLIVAAAFTPVKARVEAFVAQQFRDAHEETLDLRKYGDQVRAFVQMSDVTQITHKLLAEAVRALRAESGALSLLVDGRLEVVHTVGPWRNDARMSIILHCGKHQHGLLLLGPPLPEQRYDRLEAETLQQVADQVARAVCIAWPRYRTAAVAKARADGGAPML